MFVCQTSGWNSQDFQKCSEQLLVATKKVQNVRFGSYPPWEVWPPQMGSGEELIVVVAWINNEAELRWCWSDSVWRRVRVILRRKSSPSPGQNVIPYLRPATFDADSPNTRAPLWGATIFGVCWVMPSWTCMATIHSGFQSLQIQLEARQSSGVFPISEGRGVRCDAAGRSLFPPEVAAH